MEELKKQMDKIFALARLQKVNESPENENDLIAIIRLKVDLYKQLDKVPKEKEPKK